MEKRKVLGISLALSGFSFVLYLLNKYWSKLFEEKQAVVTGYSVSELDSLKNTIIFQDAEINRLKQSNSNEIFEVVKVTQDGQTVFYSSIMPVNYNKNRLQIIINNDLVLSNNDGYIFNTYNQQLTLTLPGISLEINNEVKFCFY